MGKNKKRKLNAIPHVNTKRHQQQQSSQKATTTTNTHKPPRPSISSEPTLPFQPQDRILLIGEGDFSFAQSLVEHHHCTDVTATSFDSRSAVLTKYHPQAENHIQYLEDAGQTVLHGVDATKSNSVKSLRAGGGKPFDVIIFNFPHVGGKSKDVNRQVRFNQELLVNFFSAAISTATTTTTSSVLAETGEIIVTLFEGEPYTLWNIRDLARYSGLEVQRSGKFVPEMYPGYKHARTLGNIEGAGGAWKGEDRDAKSYVFRRKGSTVTMGAKGKRLGVEDSGGQQRKRRKHDESSNEDG